MNGQYTPFSRRLPAAPPLPEETLMLRFRAIMFQIGVATQHPPLPDSGELSELGISFIEQCLTIDPDERPTASELLESPWLESLIEQLQARSRFLSYHQAAR